MKRSITALAGAILVLTGAVTAAGAQTPLRVGIVGDPDSLDPTTSRAATARLVLSNICDKLFEMTPDLKLVPVLALGHEWSEDGKALTLKLRPGVKFQDGEPFDAEAVRFNFDRNLNLPGSLRRPEVGLIRTITVLDDLTIRFELAEPLVSLVPFLADRAGMMLSPKAVKAAGDKFGLHPVCAGPFKFVEWINQEKIVVEKFDGYWDRQNVHLDRIEFIPMVDSTVRLANLRSGRLQVIERASPTDVPQIESDRNTKVAGIAEQGYTFIRYNVGKGPRGALLGADPRLREAIEAAIDRQTIVDVVFEGRYVAGNQWMPPESYYYNKALPLPKRDVARAKKLLADAGKPNLAFTLSIPPERDYSEAAQVMQAMLAEAGIKMAIETLENVALQQAAKSGNYEAQFTFWSGRPDPDGNIFTFFTCKGPLNDTGYCNPELDKLLTAARQAPVPADRKKLYDEGAAIVMRDRPVLTTWHRFIFTGLAAKVDGYVPHSDGVIRLKGVKLL